MISELTFTDYAAQLRAFMRATTNASSATSGDFNDLALALFKLQYQHNTAYRQFCEYRGVVPAHVLRWPEIPAIPTTAFKELELTSLAPAERTSCFLSSGTTEQRRSRHFHCADSLSIYESSLLPWFEHHVLGDLTELAEDQMLGPLERLPFLALTPPPKAAPNSSLVHMFDTVRREFGAPDSLFTGRTEADGTWLLDLDDTLFALRKSMCANRPLVLLGTAFNFVHLLDHFAANNIRYQLARGSRVLETGGYKGQSRTVPKGDLHALIGKHLGLAPDCILTEYGMSELSSQAYDRVAANSSPACFGFPPWARAQVVSPETGREVREGETGLLRLFDLANVRSVMAIQTEDLAIRRGHGFELLGRTTEAEPRGCSLMSAAVLTQR